MKKIFIFLAVLVILSLIGFGFIAYKVLYHPNVNTGEEKSTYIHIPTNSTYDDVKNILYDKNLIISTRTFEWLAERKNYRNHVNPGRYYLTSDMGNNELINLLRSGQQKPVRLTFSNISSKKEFATTVAQFIEADSSSIISKLNDPEFMLSYGFKPNQAKLMFIPNTYEFYWNTSAKEFFDRMYSEYRQFWNESRKQKAADLNMTPEEVGILASIVQLETNKRDEISKIAGVYINRLNRNMPLQADPTVIFALGDFSINRVLNRHLKVDSPYNTYKHRGLPPGPISMPEPVTINRVLNYEKHDYLYFSAKEDFSGYHNFAETYSQHIANARRYRQALNERQIMN